ncbi:MqnA/MqnD/SBP family protein [Helicobacter canis]|uniref:Chorismate dehydratase n=1 Tax=Helicobacter canis NCTC 12740 TaxID=1357399 RepID=V8CF93_9HELI|nr:MqnA/MqnD/SBP family protein [Helicobacter canis]ETD25777.1 hypothetical protein HMPREF2087_01608 [Helicobacter canis NCTC 12740]
MRFGKIQYLNLMPFDVFLKSCPIPTRYKSAAFANRSYPSKLNQSFLFHRIDAGFISTIAGYTAHRKQRGTQAGIVAKGAVWSVLSLESNGDSALGEQCGSVANFTKETSPTASGVPCFVKGTTAKVANLPQSLQSSHSPTAIPRILKENNQAESGKFKHPLESLFSKVDSSPQAQPPRKDYQSDTSNALSTILGLQGRVLIGDRALQYRFSGGKAIDMGQIWWEKHHLPFVFGRLCYNKHAHFYANIARAFVKKRAKIPHYILQARAKACGIPSAYIREYLTHIHYHIQAKERAGLERFYRALRLQAIKPPSRIYPRNVDSSKCAPNAPYKGSSNV